VEQVQVESGVTVVTLARSYDATDPESNQRAEGLLRGLGDRAEPPLVLLDMARTTTVNSSFIGLLFAVGKTLRARGGELAICAPDAFCSDVFRIVRLGEMFKSYATRADGVAAMAAGKASTGDTDA
jgi:anti-anti-sigma regulatory factor